MKVDEDMFRDYWYAHWHVVATRIEHINEKYVVGNKLYDTLLRSSIILADSLTVPLSNRAKCLYFAIIKFSLSELQMIKKERKKGKSEWVKDRQRQTETDRQTEGMRKEVGREEWMKREREGEREVGSRDRGMEKEGRERLKKK